MGCACSYRIPAEALRELHGIKPVRCRGNCGQGDTECAAERIGVAGLALTRSGSWRSEARPCPLEHPCCVCYAEFTAHFARLRPPVLSPSALLFPVATADFLPSGLCVVRWAVSFMRCALNSIPIGLALGVAVGAAIGASLDQQRKQSDTANRD